MREKHLNVLTINIGEERHDMLDRLSPDGRSRKLHDLRFEEFFAWLSRSVQKVSQTLSWEEQQIAPTASWEDYTR